ncbi:MAG: YegS/Rv2252/BmrU family lipid kinase [Crocinitomicaceae bacterium]|nr:YegS/Rv2252/BmrU family lipid kinase [Crocinitomicaceae bacterium]
MQELKKNKLLFIINPISGVGKKNIIPPLIEKYLDHQKFSYEIAYTNHRGHAREIAHEAKLKHDAVIAIGGDGSVNETGSALVDSACALGIIPCGSGNGLARYANIPLNHIKAIQRINRFEKTAIDTGLVNDTVFLGTCGFGFDAHVAKKFDEYHKRGFISYIKLVLREFGKYEPEVFIFTDQKTSIRHRAFMCSVANSGEFGNGFKISPLSELTDGKFELILLDKIKKSQLTAVAWKFFKGKIHQSNHCTVHSFENSASILTESGTEIDFHVDGEPAGCAEKFTIQIKPSSLILI